MNTDMIIYRDRQYGRVRGEELVRLVRGSTIRTVEVMDRERPDKIYVTSDGGGSSRFGTNGEFVSHGHHNQVHREPYTVSHNEVCVEGRGCFGLFKAANGALMQIYRDHHALVVLTPANP